MTKRRAIEVQVQIAVRRRHDALDAGNRSHGLRELLRDRARRFAQRPRELERDRHREIARARASAAPRPRTAARRRCRTCRRIASGDGVVDVALNTQNHGRVRADRACNDRQSATPELR